MTRCSDGSEIASCHFEASEITSSLISPGSQLLEKLGASFDFSREFRAETMTKFKSKTKE